VSLAERSEPFTVEDGLLTDVGGTLRVPSPNP
jgi:hypothetical protein